MTSPVLSDIAALRQDLDEAAVEILDHTLRGMALCEAAELDRTALRDVCSAILAACSFQDLAGQRLQRIEDNLLGKSDGRDDAHLLNGPSNGGPDQAAIDALFGNQGDGR
jgi:hypothetical protein